MGTIAAKRPLMISAGIAVLAVLGGCDTKTNEASRAVSAELARYVAATSASKVSEADAALTSAVGAADASSAAKANAEGAMGAHKAAQAIPVIQSVEAQFHEVVTLISDIDLKATEVQVIGSVIDGYSQQSPDSAREAFTKEIASIQGGAASGSWIAQEKTDLKTVAATAAQVSELQAQAAQLDTQIKDLASRRSGLLDTASEAAAQARQSSGSDALAHATRASNLRKQAADLSVESDKLQNQLVPVQRDLAMALAHQKILTSGVGRLQDQLKAIDTGWAATQEKIAGQKEYARNIIDTTIKTKADRLNEVLAQLDPQIDAAAALLTDAATRFESAASAASAAQGEVSAGSSGLPYEQKMQAALKAVFNPDTYRHKQALALKDLASLLALRAEAYAGRAKVAEKVAGAVGKVGASVPAPLMNLNAGQVADAKQAATDAFTKATDILTPLGTEGTSSLITTRYAWSQFASVTGDPQAQELLDLAVRTRDEAFANPSIVLYALPAELDVPRKAPAEEAPAAPDAPAPVEAPAPAPAPAP